MSIESRIQGRKDCQACLEMLGGDDDYFNGVMRECLDYAAPLIPKPQELLTMSNAEASRFGCERITFGKYAGTEYRDVPRDYLEWLADEALKLQSYLRATQRGPRND